MAWWKRDKESSLTVGVRSDVGRVRTNNEDSYGIFEDDDSVRLFIVADGMGGHEAGEVASQMAVETVQREFFSQPDRPVAERLRAAFRTANERVYSYSNGRSSGTMGTTCTVLALEDGRVYVGHAGDSRIYRITPEGITQITRDHTVASDMQSAGILTDEEAKRHPRRNALTRALGADPALEVDIFEERGGGSETQYLMCSDGLLLVPPEELYEVARSLPPQEACDELVRRANAQGGPDNITVLIVAFQ